MELEFIEDLYEHQKEAVKKLKTWENTPLYNVKGGILAFKMGLGKTRTMLEIVNTNKSGLTLVVCKKSNIQVWKNEIEKFYPGELNYFVLHPSYNKMCDDFPQSEITKYNIIITTYEVVRKQFGIADPECYVIRENNFMPIEASLYQKSKIPEKYKIVTVKKPTKQCKNYSPMYSTKWQRIITDESQNFAGTNTKLCQAMIALCAQSYFCLSGTPIVNYSTDLYSLFRFMGHFCVIKDWTKNYFYLMGFNNRILIKDYEDTNIKLPEMKMINIQVELSDMEKELYNAIVVELRNQFNLFSRGLTTFAAPLAMFTRLRQICVCSYIITKESKRKSLKQKDKEAMENLGLIEKEETKINELFKHEHQNKWIKDISNVKKCEKMRKVISIIHNILNEKGKVIIFSSFVTVLDLLKRIIEKKYGNIVLQLDGSTNTTDREDMVKAFNSKNGKYKIFLSSYKAGGLGINLTGADNVILMEPWWNTATEEQAICRSHRIGQTKPIKVYSLIAFPSFETYLLKVQARKNSIAKEYINNYNQKYSRLDKSSVAKELIQHVLNGNNASYFI